MTLLSCVCLFPRILGFLEDCDARTFFGRVDCSYVQFIATLCVFFTIVSSNIINEHFVKPAPAKLTRPIKNMTNCEHCVHHVTHKTNCVGSKVKIVQENVLFVDELAFLPLVGASIAFDSSSLSHIYQFSSCISPSLFWSFIKPTYH